MLRRDDGQSRPNPSGELNSNAEPKPNSRSHRIDPAQRFDDVLESFPEAVRELAELFQGTPSLQDLWDQCADTERSFEALLLDAGAVSPEELARVYSQHYSLPLFQPTDKDSVSLDPSLAQRLDLEWCVEYSLVPLADDGSTMEIATASSESLSIESQLEAITGRRIQFFFAALPTVEGLIRRLYPDCRFRLASGPLQDVTLESRSDTSLSEPTTSAPQLCSAPYLHRLFKLALQREASDVQLDYFDTFCQCQLRVQGSLIPCVPPELSEVDAIRAELVELCEIDAAVREQANWSGECRVRFGRRVVNVSVTYAQTPAGGRFGFSLAGRDQAPRELDRVGFSASQLTRLREIVSAGPGLTLVCGDADAGKLATAYALLNDLADRDLVMATCEYSPRYLIDGVQQHRVRPGETRAVDETLQSIREHSPDVLLVTTLDDAAAWQHCLQLAQSGTRVIAVANINSANDLGSESETEVVATEVLEAVCDSLILQRLFDRCCSGCSRATTLSVQKLRDHGVDENWIERHAMSSGELCVWRGNGCEQCGGRGTLGSIAAFGLAERFDGFAEAKSQVGQRALQLLSDGLVRWEDFQQAFGAEAANSG